jgi:hypothetical protein
MDDMSRGLPPRYIYPEPAPQGSYDAQGRLAGYYHSGEDVPQSAEQEQEFPPQEPRSPHSHSYHDEHGRLSDGNGRCFDVDGQVQRPQYPNAVAPSSFNETTQQQRGNAPSQNLTSAIDRPPPPVSQEGTATHTNLDYPELNFSFDDLIHWDDNMNPVDPPPGWPSSTFDIVKTPGAYGQGVQYGIADGQDLLTFPEGTIDPAVFQEGGSKALPPPQQASGRDTNALSVYGQEFLPYFDMNKGYPQYPAMRATPLSGASRSAFQAPTARMAPRPTANLDPLLLELDRVAAAERDRLNPSSSRQQSSKLVKPSMFGVYKCSLSRDEPHGQYPELPSTVPSPPDLSNFAARSHDSTATSNATQQPNGWTSMPPPPPPPPPPQHQQASGLDTTAPNVYGQTLPYSDPGNVYPHLSPSDPLPADIAFAAQYVRENHLSPEIYPLVLTAYANNHLTSPDPPVGAAQLSNYHIARDQLNFHNSTLHATFSGTLNGHVHHNNPTQNFGLQQQQQRPHPGFASQRPNLNAPNLPRPSENVHHHPPQNPLHNPAQNPNDQTTHPYYGGPATTPLNATPPTPIKREYAVLNRALGPKASTPLDDSIKPLVAALKALQPVNKKEKHPNRNTLKKPFTHIDVATPAQLLIRDHFLSGHGTIRPESKLLGWFGDDAVFERVFWNYLVEGKPRGGSGKRKRGGGGDGDGGDDGGGSDVGGGVKKQKKKKLKRDEQGEEEGTK